MEKITHLKTKNWKLPTLIGGIVFFSIIGWLNTTTVISINYISKFLVTNWCLGLFFGLSICIYILDFKIANRNFFISLLFPLSLLFSAILVAQNFHPDIIFFIGLISWIVWAVYERVIEDLFVNKFGFWDLMTVAWLILGFYTTLGQYVLNYSEDIIKKVYSIHIFLDLRLLLLFIIILATIIQSLTKVNFDEINTKGTLEIKDDKGNLFLIMVRQFYIILNFIIEIIWWLVKFFKLWGIECIKTIHERSKNTRSTLLHSLIMIMVIFAFHLVSMLSRRILTYLTLESLTVEIIPFFKCALLATLIVIISFLINRLQNLKWKSNQLTLETEIFVAKKKKLLELIPFPFLTAGLSGLVLFILAKIPVLKIQHYQFYGFYTLLLSILLVLAILIDILTKLKKPKTVFYENDEVNLSEVSIPKTDFQKIDLNNIIGSKKNWKDKKFLNLFDWNKRNDGSINDDFDNYEEYDIEDERRR